jgi:hypothetical protein
VKDSTKNLLWWAFVIWGLGFIVILLAGSVEALFD